MKPLPIKLIALPIILSSLFITTAQAAQLPKQLKPIQQNTLCDLFGLSCPTITTKTSGSGKEPEIIRKKGD